MGRAGLRVAAGVHRRHARSVRRRKAVAIEPMTCPPNAFVSGVDLLMLEPGDSVTHTWGIEVTPT